MSSERTGRARGVGEALRWGAFLGLLMAVFTRASVLHEPFPYWELDPARTPASLTGFGPAQSVLADVATLALAGLCLLGEGLVGRRVSYIAPLLLGLGSLPVFLHAGRGDGLSIDDAQLGSAWTAAMSVGVAAMHICREDRVRRLCIALAIGFAAMLAVRGAVQVYVEHPATVADYEAHRDTVLASKGWEPGSISARTYERRLYQPEATGWFGLANVYATVAAVSFTGFLGLTVLALRSGRDRSRTVLVSVVLGLALAGTAVALSNSNAGLVLCAAGGALILLVTITERYGLVSHLPFRPRTAGALLALAAIGAVLVGVAARGVVGERLGERSLLFRWFYIEAAARIFAQHPLAGVGPAGFKDAYLLAKNPLSPEEVASPHSLIFDHAAALGMLGLCWTWLWMCWVWRAGRSVFAGDAFGPRGGVSGPHTALEPAGPEHLPEPRVDLWVLFGVAAVPTLISAWCESEMATVSASGGRIAGLGVWVAVAAGALSVMRRGRWHWIGGICAVIAAMHFQIEMTPVQPGSAAWSMLLLASAGAGAHERGRPLRFIAPAVCIVLAAAIGLLALGRIGAWQRELRSAAMALEPIATIRVQLAGLDVAGAPAAIADISARLSGILGRPLPDDPEGSAAAMAEAHARLARQAIGAMEEALSHAPGHLPTRRELGKLRLGESEYLASRSLMQTAVHAGEAAERIAVGSTELHPRSASAWHWLGVARVARARIESDPSHLGRAAEAFRGAAYLDPFGMGAPVRLYETYRQLGDDASAALWARRALEIDRLLRLDPLKGLTDRQRNGMRAFLGGLDG